MSISARAPLNSSADRPCRLRSRTLPHEWVRRVSDKVVERLSSPSATSPSSNTPSKIYRLPEQSYFYRWTRLLSVDRREATNLLTPSPIAPFWRDRVLLSRPHFSCLERVSAYAPRAGPLSATLNLDRLRACARSLRRKILPRFFGEAGATLALILSLKPNRDDWA